MTRIALIFVFALASIEAQAIAQQESHIGYLYPAGGQIGTTVDIAVGGQFLDGANSVIVSGQGVSATVVEHTKPLTQQEVNRLRQKIQEAQMEIQKQRGSRFFRFNPANFASYADVAEKYGITGEDLRKLSDFRQRLQDPKRQLNPQIAETVTLKVTLDADAEPGPRELRLRTSRGLSNPMKFEVGTLREYQEREPNDEAAETGIDDALPIVINGQVMPGDVDRFAFSAQEGLRLVVAVAARDLIPYLADAVPGWFQATAALYDASGKEVAYADDFRFQPDPVLYYRIPADGEYVLEVKDAIYRGREDFVYRISLGELPFVTALFPLGTQLGDSVLAKVDGWNLESPSSTVGADLTRPGVHEISIGQDPASNRVRFAVDPLPQFYEVEPNDQYPDALSVTLPLIINGRVDSPGDWDAFQFEALRGDRIVAEVMARRLNSPLDSVLELTDAEGKRIAVNDDYDDPASALTTHQADSRITAILPADGVYYLRLGDTQGQGGGAYAYRLRISRPRPDFDLRFTPASINARAGTSVPIDVHAVRRDGFEGSISLRLQNIPWGFSLSGAELPAGEDHVRLTLTAPAFGRDQPIPLGLVGTAAIGGRTVRREAVPAEDMMQAFAYRHLVPAAQAYVSVIGQGRARPPLRLIGDLPAKIPRGGTARVEFAMPPAAQLNQIKLELSDPPEGVSIQDKSAVEGGVAVLLTADDSAVAGQKGNLIIEAFIERSFRAGAPARRFPIGTLPAVPFEIVLP